MVTQSQLKLTQLLQNVFSKKNKMILSQSHTSGNIDTSISYANDTGSTITANTICIVSGNNLVVADNSQESTISGKLAIPANDIASGESGSCRVVNGSISGFSGLSVGVSYRLGSNGAITSDPPNEGELVRHVGYAESETALYFFDNGLWFEAGAVPDTENPSTPTGLTATAISDTQIDLSWTVATDNVEVDHYILRRDGTPIGGEIEGLSYSDSSLQSETEYSYTIESVDTSANESGQSSSVSATTEETPALSTQIEFTSDADNMPLYLAFSAGTATLHIDGADDVPITSETQLNHSFGSASSRNLSITMTNPESLTQFGATNEWGGICTMDNVSGLDGFVNLATAHFYACSTLTTISVENCSNLRTLYFGNTGLTTPISDQICIDLDNATPGLTGAGGTCVVRLVTESSATARANLTEKGFDVQVAEW